MSTVVGSAQAQTPGKLGIGIGVSQDLFNVSVSEGSSMPLSSITFPMNLGAFRLEPEFAFTGGSFEFGDPDFGGIEVALSGMLIGAGAYMLSGPDDGFMFYGGPRFGIIRNSETDKTTDPESSITSTDMFFGVALGGEHLFSSHLSLGAEARLTHYRSGGVKYDPEPPGGAGDDPKSSATLTSGVVMVRFYF